MVKEISHDGGEFCTAKLFLKYLCQKVVDTKFD